MLLFTDEPKTPGWLCLPSEEAERSLETAEVFGQGFHPDDITARIKAVAECLERLCVYNPDPARFKISTRCPSSERVDPASFRPHSKEQLANLDSYLQPVRNSPYRWLPVTELPSGRSTAVPAQMVFISSIFDDEYPIRKEQITTGTALGVCGTDQALEAGLLEVVERDGCISAYLKKADIPRIVDLPPEIVELVHYFQRYLLEPHLFDVTSDLGIPTVLVITIDRTGIGPAVTVGSRASATFAGAIRGALLESVQCRRTSRVIKSVRFPNGFPSEEEVTSMQQRFYYWYPVERIADLEFWLHTGRRISYCELSSQQTTLSDATATIKGKGYHIFVADITLPEIKQRGFEVLKVVIPELHPLYLDERAKCLYSVHHGEIKDDPSLRPHPLT